MKQAPCQWYLKFDNYMTQKGFTRCALNPCVYYKRLPTGEFVILLLYVDDMLTTGNSMRIIYELKTHLALCFSMKDLGVAKRILGMDIIRNRHKREIRLSQEKYILKVLQKFNMSNAKSVATPLANYFLLSSKMCPSTAEEKREMDGIPYSSAVGSLMYVMVSMCPDLAHAVRVVSGFMSNPSKTQWQAIQ